jgi:hypothetical protein
MKYAVWTREICRISEIDDKLYEHLALCKVSQLQLEHVTGSWHDSISNEFHTLVTGCSSKYTSKVNFCIQKGEGEIYTEVREVACCNLGSKVDTKCYDNSEAHKYVAPTVRARNFVSYLCTM